MGENFLRFTAFAVVRMEVFGLAEISLRAPIVSIRGMR